MKLTGKINRFTEPNTDTDLIIPARFLKRTALDGFEVFAFFEKRYLPSSICEATIEARDFVFKKKDFNPDCTINHPNSRDATFLLTWANFGCGSSREHAVYALRNYKVIIGSAPEGKTAFADIFRDNCRQNLIWTPVISESDHKKLLAFVNERIDKAPVSLILDADAQKLSTEDGALSIPFEIPPHHKSYILAGKDPFDMAREQVQDFGKKVNAWFSGNAEFSAKSPNALLVKK